MNEPSRNAETSSSEHSASTRRWHQGVSKVAKVVALCIVFLIIIFNFAIQFTSKDSDKHKAVLEAVKAASSLLPQLSPLTALNFTELLDE